MPWGSFVKPSRAKPRPATTGGLYSTADVASALRVTTRSVKRWIASGALQALKVGSRWRITSEGLDAFLARRSRLF